MQLSSEQLSQFHTDGFIVLKNFLDEKRCDEILKVAKKHLYGKVEPIETELGYDERSKEYRTDVTDYASKSNSEGMVVRRLRQAYGRDVLFKAWMENEKIRPVLQQVLDDQVVLTLGHHNSIMTKLPHVSTATSWHQDRRYWRYSDDNLVSIWLALDDESSKNGALEFIPGSHTMHFSPEQFNDKEYFSESYEDNKKIIADKKATNLRKGDVVLFHCLLLHRANKNTTEQTKISFVYTVKGKNTKAEEGSRSAEFPEIVLEEYK
jgi:phytanoyl-CoA hydroxylase